MPETVVDLWRLVYDYNACAIVTMDDWDINDRVSVLFDTVGCNRPDFGTRSQPILTPGYICLPAVSKSPFIQHYAREEILLIS